MNTYTRSMTPEAADRTSSAGGKMKFAGFAGRISLLILLIFFAISAQMHLRVEIERLNKRAMQIRMEISELNVQCTNLPKLAYAAGAFFSFRDSTGRSVLRTPRGSPGVI